MKTKKNTRKTAPEETVNNDVKEKIQTADSAVETASTETQTSEETTSAEPETSEETTSAESETSEETAPAESETSEETTSAESETSEETAPAEPETTEETSPAAEAKPKRRRKVSPKAAAKAAAHPFVWCGRKLRALPSAVRNSLHAHPVGWKRAAVIALVVLLVANITLTSVMTAVSVQARRDSDWATSFAGYAFDTVDTLQSESTSTIDELSRSMREWETEESIFSGTIGDNLAWEVDPETATLTITGEGEMCSDFNENVRPAFSMLYQNFVRNLVVDHAVTSIAPFAFADFTKLQTVTLGESMELIGWRAFEGCESLYNVDLTCTSLQEIGEYAFSNCRELDELILPDTFCTYNCFVDDNTVRLYVSDDNNTFRCDDNGALYTADGKTLLYARYQYDYNYSETSDFTIAEGVENLENGCMRGCAFNRLVIPGSVKEIYLKDTGVQTINRLVLSDGVESLHFHDKNCADWNSDRYIHIETLIVPDTLRHIDENIFSHVSRIKFSADSDLLKMDEEGSIYSANGKTLLKVAEVYDRNSYTVRDGVERIGNGATETLYLYDGTLTLPDTLKSIGDNNFCYISIRKGKTLTLPDSLEKIGNNCFEYLTADKIVIPSSVTKVGENMLKGSNNNRCSETSCTKGDLTVVYPGDEFLFQLLIGDTLPNGVVVECAD